MDREYYDNSTMIKNGQCQMCGHFVLEGHNCWDGRGESDMIYLKPSQIKEIVKKDCEDNR